MQAVILAAGKGTRLHPVTATRSKAMAPVAGKPIVHRVMETLMAHGISSFILVVSPEDEEIRAYFAEQGPPAVDVSFVDQTERLGMAHALGLAAPAINGPFILSACDNLVPESFIGSLLSQFENAACNAVLSLKPVAEERIPSVGIVDIEDDGLVRRIVEKPSIEEAPSNIGSMPLYLFSQKLLDYLPRVQPSPRGEYELQDAIQMLIEEAGRVYGVFTETRLQLTNTADLLNLNRHYLTVDAASQIQQASKMGAKTVLNAPLRIEAQVTIGNGCSIGPNVVLEKGCVIGEGVSISDAMVLRGGLVQDGQQVNHEVVI